MNIFLSIIFLSSITQWLGVLEATAQILVIPPFYENLGKRLIKSPRMYVADSGFACHLLGIDSSAGRGSSLSLVECKGGRTVTPAMAAPMQRVAESVKRKRPKGTKVAMFLVHQPPQAGSRIQAIAPGVRALPWRSFLNEL